MIDYSAFCATLINPAPPAAIAREVESLWWVRHGNWEKAHQIVQDLESGAAARVHAYLHRLEGDLENATYWYRRADQPVPEQILAEEWEVLVRTLLLAL